MSLVPRGIQGLLRPTSFVLASTLNRFLASAVKGTVAFSGGKLGGGLSSTFIVFQAYFFLNCFNCGLFLFDYLEKGAQTQRKIELQVETDPNKLAKFCCGLNILKTGGTEVELKPNSEYPDWLWTLSLDRGPSLDEMKPDTLEYWTRKRRIALRYKNKLMRDRFPQPFIPKTYKNLRPA